MAKSPKRSKAYVDKAFRDADDFTIDLQHYVTEQRS